MSIRGDGGVRYVGPRHEELVDSEHAESRKLVHRSTRICRERDGAREVGSPMVTWHDVVTLHDLAPFACAGLDAHEVHPLPTQSFGGR